MDGYCCRMVPYRVMDGFVNLTIVRDQWKLAKYSFLKVVLVLIDRTALDNSV